VRTPPRASDARRPHAARPAVTIPGPATSTATPPGRRAAAPARTERHPGADHRRRARLDPDRPHDAHRPQRASRYHPADRRRPAQHALDPDRDGDPALGAAARANDRQHHDRDRPRLGPLPQSPDASPASAPPGAAGPPKVSGWPRRGR
jgi:hypothetical protein